MPGRERGGSGRGGLTAAGGDFVQLVIDYAKQETLGPIKGLGRFVAFGMAGSVAITLGTVLLLLAVLRALQTETGSSFTGKLSWLPYVITGGVAAVVMGLAAWRITKGPARAGRPRTGQGQGQGQEELTMATTAKITRDDLEAKLRAMSGDLDETVEAAKPTIVTSAVAGLVLAMLVAYLFGRRRGRARSAVVEIRKV